MLASTRASPSSSFGSMGKSGSMIGISWLATGLSLTNARSTTTEIPSWAKKYCFVEEVTRRRVDSKSWIGSGRDFGHCRLVELKECRACRRQANRARYCRALDPRTLVNNISSSRCDPSWLKTGF